MNLPQSKNLPINYLSSVFNNTTNSYKFYWFIAILECVRESSEMLIPMSKILAKMISTVWYPVNYFKISFGKFDRLGNIALDVKSESSLAPDSKRYKVVDVVRIILSETSNTTLRQNLNSLMRFVPYRFLRPWFASELKGLTDLSVNSKIIELANKNFHNVKNISMYRFNNGKEKHIELQKLWFNYLVEHNRILMDFSFWNLIKYLQKNNPNVPNIPKKLFAPEARNLKRARNFWDLVLDDYREVSCIYSQLPIIKDKYSIDHFIPWRFVTHDLMWNLLPVPKNINSVKSDSLPSLNRYFDQFAQIQQRAFKIVFRKNKMKLLEDYSNLYQCELKEIYEMSENKFKDKLYSTVAPLTQIAENMGFESRWIYQK